MQVPGKVEEKIERKRKPEVDVKDEKVVDHIRVVAVLRMHVNDPENTLSVKRIEEHEKTIFELMKPCDAINGIGWMELDLQLG